MHQVLAGIERRLQNDALELLPCDPWLASSVMQKAIRRSETERAVRAAITLWHQDKVRFWRRLHVTALEDIGPADTEAVIEALTVIPEQRWRKQAGDLRVGLAIVRRLCKPPKSRLADQTYIIAERGAGYAKMRIRLAMLPADTLHALVIDDTATLIERLLALWLLAGTKRYPSDLLSERDGNLHDAVRAMRGMGAPASLVAACVGVLRKTSWPLALFMPLLCEEAKKHRTSVKVNSLLPVPDVNGIPLYGADWFTRTGRACITRLQKAAPAFKVFSGQQIGLTVFYMEGGYVGRELTSPALDAFKQEGELADIESAGLDAPRYLGLLELMERHWLLFNEIRTDALKRYVQERKSWS